MGGNKDEESGPGGGIRSGGASTIDVHTGMKRGDIFNTHGYCLVASIDCANEEGGGPDGPGRVLVMHNNSTHFLVALAPLASLEMAIESGTEEQIVELLASFYYSGGSQPEITAYYRQALLLAMEEALKR